MITLALDTQLLDTPYRIVGLIGEGGMGRVYEATHARLAGRYAVKVLLKSLSHNPDAIALFEREARVTSSLQHPNIVQVIDFNATADGTEYLVMEHLRGESLAQRLLREKSLPLDTTAGIVEQVAAGLMAAHTHGVVHRDLKPDNVFLVPVEGSQRPWAKILDFGIALIRRPGASLSPDCALVGTPLYMSPEQLSQPAAAVDAATDQFALAVMTYEMLTGRTPFGGNTLEAVVSQVLTGEPPPMGFNAEVEGVVRRGLAKAPARRYPSVVAFCEALRAAVMKTSHELDATLVGISARASARTSTSAATSAMLGELNPPKAEGLRRRRPRGVVSVVAGAAAASVALSLLLGQPMTRGEGRRRPPPLEAGAPGLIGLPTAIEDSPAPVATVTSTATPDSNRPSTADESVDRDSPAAVAPMRQGPNRLADRTSGFGLATSSRVASLRAARLRQRHGGGRIADTRAVGELPVRTASSSSFFASPFEPTRTRRAPSIPKSMTDGDEPMPPSEAGNDP